MSKNESIIRKNHRKMDCSQVDTLDLSVWLSFFDYIPRFFETGLLFSLIPSLLPAAGISNSNASMRISRGRRSQAGLTKVIVNGYTKTVSRLFIILQTVSRKRAKLCNTNIAVDLRVANGPRINCPVYGPFRCPSAKLHGNSVFPYVRCVFPVFSTEGSLLAIALKY